MALAQLAVDMNAGSYRNSDGSSSRSAVDGNVPRSMGTVTVRPVRSSVIVMVSGIAVLLTPRGGAFLPRGMHARMRRRLIHHDIPDDLLDHAGRGRGQPPLAARQGHAPPGQVGEGDDPPLTGRQPAGDGGGGED